MEWMIDAGPDVPSRHKRLSSEQFLWVAMPAILLVAVD